MQITAGYFMKSIAELIASVFSSALATVGSITIIFFLIQHFGNFDNEKVDFYEDWTPKDLPELPEEKDRVQVWEPIVAMFFIAVGFFFVNFFVAKGQLPYYMGEGSEVQILPIFNKDVVKSLLPLWNLSFGLSFINEIIMLIKRKRTLGTRLFEIGISLLVL